MHKAKLGQKQNKRTYKDGKENMTVTGICCPVASSSVLAKGKVLTPRLQRVLALQSNPRLDWSLIGLCGLDSADYQVYCGTEVTRARNSFSCSHVHVFT